MHRCYFKNIFIQWPYEHAIYVRKKRGNMLFFFFLLLMLMTSFFLRNNEEMIEEFKRVMTREFEVSYLC